MDYRCWLGGLVNSSTASGSSDGGEDGRPELQLGRRDILFFPARYAFFHIHSSHLLPLCLCLISYLLFLCASVWENTRA